MLLKHTVLVTGASSGIGSACAVRFAEGGYRVVCHYNSENKNLDELRKNLKPYGTQTIFIKADFTSHMEILRFVKEIKALKISVLINNAGTYLVKKHFIDLSLMDLDKTFSVNVYAPVLIASVVFNYMKKIKFGRIVNISSIAAKYGGSNESMHYGCSKRALEGLTQTLAREGAEFNVFANTIRPGVIDTDFHNKFPKNMSKRIAKIPVKKMGQPSDIADMAFYLASEKNNFITNQVITVSGGE
jgi:3-oxoacyl-[acyl-carrier protein] reductase